MSERSFYGDGGIQEKFKSQFLINGLSLVLNILKKYGRLKN